MTVSCAGASFRLDQPTIAIVFEQMIAAFKRAIELDPAYAEPYAGLAFAYCLDFQNHWADTPDALDLAARFAAQAIEKGPNEPYVHCVAAIIKFWQRDLEAAKAAAEKALALNPNYALAYGSRGLIELYLGHPLAAIPHIERAMRLDPALHASKRALPWFSLSGGGSVRCRGGRLPRADPSYAKDRPVARLPRFRTWPPRRVRRSAARLARTERRKPEIFLRRAPGSVAVSEPGRRREDQTGSGKGGASRLSATCRLAAIAAVNRRTTATGPYKSSAAMFFALELARATRRGVMTKCSAVVLPLMRSMRRRADCRPRTWPD